jgi:hypothetical protein
MTSKMTQAWAVAGAVAMGMLCITPASAQMQEVKEKPKMYSYVAFWAIPRSQWAEETKNEAAGEKFTQKGMADGQLVGYGTDQTLVHTADGATHDTWFSSMSMAGLLNVLDQVYRSGIPTGPVEAAATKHWDEVLVSRYYNWHSGSWKDVYSYALIFKLKPDAPQDTVDMVSKNLFVPMLEKLLADGTIHEYEIDEQAVHTDAPGTFSVDYIAANAEAFDKVNAAIGDAIKADPLGSSGFRNMVDWSVHHDDLLRTNATYK